jgi:uncharacterized membrane protein
MAKLPPSTLPKRLYFSRVLLRLGLAFVFAFAAISSFLMPEAWLGFIPTFVPVALAKPSLDFFSVVQLVLVVWLLWGKWLKYSAAAGSLLLLALTLANLSSFVITFRDIGLAVMAAALAIIAED